MITSSEVEELVRPALKKVEPYTPVQPTRVLSRNINIKENNIIKIDANENPYGCSPRVRKALASYPYLSLYPDPIQGELRASLAQYTGFEVKNIIAGSGSDELIELILRLFLEPGDKVINCPPTFAMYKFCTQICAGQNIDIPRKADFTLDITSVRNAMDSKTKVIFIASPNNPTGNLISREELLELLDLKIIVVIDEAYYEFGQVTYSDLLSGHPNMLILRSFSKWAGLAGFRIGYGVFPENIANYILNIKQPYNVNIAAQIAATESLKDVQYRQSTIQKITQERSRLYVLLKKFKWLQVYDSSANFILCKVIHKDAKDLHQKLRQKGIFIRYYDTELLRNYIRISVGKPEHTDKLISALNEVI